MSDLATELGIARGARIGFVNEPESFVAAVEPLPADVRLFDRASEPLDVIVYFSDTKANVERRVPLLSQYLAPGGTLWVGYPQAHSLVAGDLTQRDVKIIGRRAGLVDSREISLGTDWNILGFHPAPDDLRKGESWEAPSSQRNLGRFLR
ncbi:MAG: hypothetical protein M3285_13360 [Actinomycetota bacterium]|nr:hypothetical protein [Actinomycetota bacterium]